MALFPEQSWDKAQFGGPPTSCPAEHKMVSFAQSGQKGNVTEMQSHVCRSGERSSKDRTAMNSSPPSKKRASHPDGTGVKNPPASARDTGDSGSIPESGRSPEEEMATCSSILASELPRTEEPAGLQSIG